MGWLLSLFGGPLISSLVEGVLSAYRAKLAAVSSTEAHEVDLASAEILGEIKMRQAAAAIVIAEQGWWVTAWIRPLFAYPLIIYFACCISASVFHYAGPAQLPPPIGDWAGWMIVAYFGGRSIEKVARIFKGVR